MGLPYQIEHIGANNCGQSLTETGAQHGGDHGGHGSGNVVHNVAAQLFQGQLLLPIMIGFNAAKKMNIPAPLGAFMGGVLMGTGRRP